VTSTPVDSSADYNSALTDQEKKSLIMEFEGNVHGYRTPLALFDDKFRIKQDKWNRFVLQKTTEWSKTVLAQVNKLREEKGAAPLEWSERLSQIAKPANFLRVQELLIFNQNWYRNKRQDIVKRATLAGPKSDYVEMGVEVQNSLAESSLNDNLGV